MLPMGQRCGEQKESTVFATGEGFLANSAGSAIWTIGPSVQVPRWSFPLAIFPNPQLLSCLTNSRFETTGDTPVQDKHSAQRHRHTPPSSRRCCTHTATYGSTVDKRQICTATEADFVCVRKFPANFDHRAQSGAATCRRTAQAFADAHANREFRRVCSTNGAPRRDIASRRDTSN